MPGMKVAVFRDCDFRYFKELKMNQHDKDNLQFLLNSTPATLKDWYDKMDEDDHAYALELIRLHSSELIVAELELTDEQEDLSLAAKYLAKYRL